MALHLVGARPMTEGTGRIARFELIPLSELNGRPRVDVLCNMSGIFRDSFQNVVELLDDLFQKAANADEPEELNFIRSGSFGICHSLSGLLKEYFIIPVQPNLRFSKIEVPSILASLHPLI